MTRIHVSPDSHIHGLGAGDLLWLTDQAAGQIIAMDDPPTVAVLTVDLPGRRYVGGRPAPAMTLPCGLYGPVMGDSPVGEGACYYRHRDDREHMSRILRDALPRESRVATVILGPHGAHRWTVYTVHGGPPAPREPGDPSLSTDEERLESRVFWSQHALVDPLADRLYRLARDLRELRREYDRRGGGPGDLYGDGANDALEEVTELAERAVCVIDCPSCENGSAWTSMGPEHRDCEKCHGSGIASTAR